MTSNSATAFQETGLLYSDFNPERQAAWIQEPISRQVFLQGKLINSLYVEVSSHYEAFIPSGELAREFAAWEAASDEALLNFEKENL
jgi:hypothetical protein